MRQQFDCVLGHASFYPVRRTAAGPLAARRQYTGNLGHWSCKSPYRTSAARCLRRAIWEAWPRQRGYLATAGMIQINVADQNSRATKARPAAAALPSCCRARARRQPDRQGDVHPDSFPDLVSRRGGAPRVGCDRVAAFWRGTSPQVGFSNQALRSHLSGTSVFGPQAVTLGLPSARARRWCIIVRTLQT